MTFLLVFFACAQQVVPTSSTDTEADASAPYYTTDEANWSDNDEADADSDVDTDADSDADADSDSDTDTDTDTDADTDSDTDTDADSDTAADADEDGDGYAASDDCDDADATINPGATETGNGVDDDCDGSVDEGIDDGSIMICVVDAFGSFDLSVLNDSSAHYDASYWFATVFLDESDAEGCREFIAYSGEMLKFNGLGDSDFWGGYLVGSCTGSESSALVIGDGVCAAVEIEVDGEAVDEFSGNDLVFTVP